MKKNEKQTVFGLLINVGFFDMKQTKGLNSAWMKNALDNLPETTPKILNLLLRALEIIEDSYEEISDNDLEGEGIEKIIIPSNINNFYTRLEILLGLKLSGHTNT